MKLTKYLFGVALTAITAGAFVSCTNELSDKMETSSGALKLLKAPEVYAWSGEQTLNATRSDVYTVTSDFPVAPTAPATRADDVEITWVPVTTDALVPEVEYVNIEKVLTEGESHFSELIADFLFFANKKTELEFYPVYGKSTTAHNIGIFYYDEEGQYHECEPIWLDYNVSCNYTPADWKPDAKVEYSTDNGCESPLDEEGNLKGYKIIIPEGYKFGFHFTFETAGYTRTWWEKEYWGPGENDFNNQQKWEDVKKGWTSSSLNYESVDVYGTPPQDEKWNTTIRAAVFYKDGKTYLGFEDWKDYDYQDIVFTAPTIIETVSQDNTKPGVTQEEFEGKEKDPDVCDRCKHPHHGPDNSDEIGTCDQCTKPGDGCYQEPDPEPCDQCGHYHEGPSTDCEECHESGPEDDEHQSCWVDPETPCEQCGHNHYGPSTDCPDCLEDGHQVEGYPGTCLPEDPEPGPNNPDKTAPDDIQNHKNEVEVNFEVVDGHEYKGKDIKDLASKLSIHVRHATDVEILIPLPTKYVIASDDLYIFNEHYASGEGYKGNYHGTSGGVTIEGGEQVLTYLINEKTVELHVKYYTPDEAKANNMDTAPFDEGYIKVWTVGIDESVINWCMLHNGDGINFEVWTYFGVTDDDDDTLRKELEEEYFNKSTIEFLDSNPDYYINAFGYDYVDGTWGQQNTGEINPDDCYVKPVDQNTYKPRTDYKDNDEWDEHLNSTPYNYIWVKSGVTPDEHHGGL